MQRGLVHAIAWSLATGAAVTLSWWGVHTVMAGTAYDPPRAVPISVDAAGQDSEQPVSSSTHRAPPTPTPSPSPSPSRSKVTPTLTAHPAHRSPSAAANTPAAPKPSPPVTASGDVKSYPTRGGQVVFELASDSAKLVSATPESKWSMQVWTNPEWIRVDFSDGGGAVVSVFCTWNGHPPTVQVVDQ